MRGHLQQRSRDTWRLKVYVGRSADGRKRYVERTVHGSRREAERELARLVVEVDEDRHVASAPMTIGELLDRWLDLKAMTVEANTANGYRWIGERYVRPAFGDRKVASIRRSSSTTGTSSSGPAGEQVAGRCRAGPCGSATP